jgi:FkbM family methyltransferase
MGRGLQVLAERIGSAGFTVIDVGVAEGTPELYAAFPGERNKYLLVEANPAYRSSLPALAERLGAEVAYAFCGAARGERAFNLYTDGRKASAFDTHGRTPSEVVEVPVVRLDDLMREHGLLEGPVVLKIDVEGAELEALGGAEETLKRAQAVILEAGLVERYKGGARFADIVAFMQAHGFAAFDIVGGGVVGTRLHLVDIIFLPEAAV